MLVLFVVLSMLSFGFLSPMSRLRRLGACWTLLILKVSMSYVWNTDSQVSTCRFAVCVCFVATADSIELVRSGTVRWCL